MLKVCEKVREKIRLVVFFLLLIYEGIGMTKYFFKLCFYIVLLLYFYFFTGTHKKNEINDC